MTDEPPETPPKTHLGGLENCPLHKRTPFGIRGVSRTQFSIARHYGACKFNGENYTYFPDTDELVRDDALKWKRGGTKKNPGLWPKAIL